MAVWSSVIMMPCAQLIMSNPETDAHFELLVAIPFTKRGRNMSHGKLHIHLGKHCERVGAVSSV